MNNKGFTLVEILAVIAILAILVIITVPAISNVSDNIMKSTLKTKIENIEKAAVLYGQEHRENFSNRYCSYCEDKETSVCSANNKFNSKCYLSNCECYKEVDASNNIIEITVGKLITENKVSEDKTVSGNKVIVNSTDESKYLNQCKIQI